MQWALSIAPKVMEKYLESVLVGSSSHDSKLKKDASVFVSSLVFSFDNHAAYYAALMTPSYCGLQPCFMIGLLAPW